MGSNIKQLRFFQWLLQTYQWQCRSTGRSLPLGFTLIELLMTMVIGSIILTALLAALVDLLNNDQREYAIAETEREMREALDYMATDLREAAYVYDGQCNAQNTASCPSIRSYLPTALVSTAEPVLMFWKPDTVPYESGQALPGDCLIDFPSDPDKQIECEVLKLRRQAYTLVVYLQTTDTTDTRWRGESRILRYELRKYTNPQTLVQTTGYVDPIDDATFEQWPFDSANTNQQAILPTLQPDDAQVLVDFVDDPANPEETPDTCATGYDRLPANPATFNSFFVCVRNSGNSDVGQNQDAVIFLRGNAQGRTQMSGLGPLPTLQTQVTLRGVVDKAPL